MSEPTRQDIEALADVISRMYGSPTDPDDHLPGHCRAMARAILSSDWLSQHLEQQHREGAAAVVARVEAVIGRESFGTFIEGRRTAHHNGAYDVCPVLDLRAALRGDTP